MTKEERQVRIKKGCNTIINIWLVIFVASLALVGLGVLWEKWNRPPQSWFLTNRRMTELAVQMSLFSDQDREPSASLHEVATETDNSRYANSLISMSLFLGGVSQTDDTTVRSRGAWLSRVLDLPKNGASYERHFMPSGLLREGLVRDHDEWLLVDFWGEPYYVIFDTNKDGKIINPQNEGSKVRPDRARQASTKAPPPILERPWPLVSPWFIYSSGPDRDPQTWDDNVIAWEVYH